MDQHTFDLALDKAGEMAGGGLGSPYPKGTPGWNKRYREALETVGLKLIEPERRPWYLSPYTPRVDAPWPDPLDPHNRWNDGAYIEPA